MATGTGVTPARTENARSRPAWFRSPTVAWVLLLLTAAPWGASAQVSGAVVAGKTVAFAAAVLIALASRIKPIRFAAVGWLLLAYAATSLIGVLVSHDAVGDSVTRSVRLAAVVLAAAWIATSLPLNRMLRTAMGVATAVSALALLGWLAGLSPFVDGRLAGFLPPLEPNSVGAMAGIGAVICAALWTRRELRNGVALLCSVALIVALLLSGSRTSTIAAGLGIVVALVIGTWKRSAGLVVWTALAVASTLFIGSLTRANLNPLAGSRFQWDSTFTGRTEGWRRVAQLVRPWPQPAVGQGLAAKYVPDPSVFGGVRPVDGTWHAAYLETGWIGLALLVSAALIMVVYSLAGSTARLALPLVVFLLADATLESALNDVTFPFAVFAGVAFAVGALPHRALLARRRAGGPRPIDLSPGREIRLPVWAALVAAASVAGAALVVWLS